MGLAVSGFVNGLDVTTVVSQLMASESQPKTLLQTQLTAVQADAAAYRNVNSKFAALLSAAQNLSASSYGATITATSADSTVAASVATGATPGSSVSFSVTQLAAAKTAISKATWTSATASVTGAGPTWPLTVLDGTGKSLGPITVPAGATLTDAANAITASNYGLKANVVQTATGEFRLQVTSKTTGTANGFQLQGSGETTADGSFTTLSDAVDATLSLGPGVTAISSTNTFSNLVNGVSVTVSKPTPTGGPATTVSVGTDTSSLTKQMQSLVDAANAALANVASTTGTAAGKAGVLAGNYTVQRLAQQVLKAVSDAVQTPGGATSAASPALIGLQLDKTGAIVFDATKFSSALATSPDLVKQLVAGTVATPGVATRLADLAKSATTAVTGTLVSLASGQDTRAKDLQSQIADWTTRLAARQDALTTQYSSLQSMLSSLQSQSSWLSGMFSSSSSSSTKSS